MNAVKDEIHFRGPQVVELAGITYRQLDYWARTGLVVPSLAEAHGSGTQRRYSKTDVVCARVVKTLSAYGIGQVSRFAGIVETIRDHWDDLTAESAIVVSGRDVRLIADPLDFAALAFADEPLLLLPLAPLLAGLDPVA